jgi:4-alpha-glucanotransferase
VRTLSLGVHDASFPGDDDEDLGRGSPYSRGGLAFVRFAHGEGFDALQLGPQGQTPADDPSPYRGSMLPKEPLSIALARLASADEWGGLVSPASFAARLAERPPGARERVAYEFARGAQGALLDEAFATFESTRDAGEAREAAPRLRVRAALAEELRRFCEEERWWLARYELYEALRAESRGAPPGGLDARLLAPRSDEASAADARIAALRARWSALIARFRFVQFVVQRQHAALRTLARELELRLFADLQIGMSEEDAWCHASLLLEGHRMGAPPSRTNPEGQPWGYPVLDPDQYDDSGAAHAPGAVRRFLAARLGRLLRDFDGVRVDHPHGLVDPWVYDAEDPDPLRAVARGARLFSSPDVPGHEALARFAIARPDQLRHDAGAPRYADDWVRWLDDEQVGRYARLFDEVVRASGSNARGELDLPCEVLSTLPFPLERVLARAGLGRFRVTQKASLADPRDVYRSENAHPEDWIMVGNHDTPPLWRALRSYAARGEVPARAAYLASRLVPRGGDATTLAARLAADPGRLAHAFFADLFASPAQHVMVFFSDLLGLEDLYNDPGTSGPSNWRLRVPPDYLARHRRAAAAGRALDLPAALALALRARDDSADGRLLAATLEREAARYVV